MIIPPSKVNKHGIKRSFLHIKAKNPIPFSLLFHSFPLVPFLFIRTQLSTPNDSIFTSPQLSPLLMTNVVEVKVGLHCDDCIKKILKAIKKIEDIETYDVDKQLNKVIVTGNVTTQEVIRVLHKIGKSASNWGEEEQINC